MQRVQAGNGVVFYRSELLAAEGVRHAFSTRVGGVSQQEYASLNLGNPLDAARPDSQENIEENYRRLCAAATLPPMRLGVHQVHGCGVVEVGEGADGFVSGQKADALVSQDTQRCIAIRTADCAAVLVAAEGGLIGAAHAGWRGVVEGVIPAMLDTMRRRGARPLAAAVFPCIGFEAFEVGMEVVEAFERVVGTGVGREVGAGKGRVHLEEACARQLAAAGINRSRIDVSGVCTVSDPEFFSHRRDKGKTGRMALLAVAEGRGGVG